MTTFERQGIKTTAGASTQAFSPAIRAGDLLFISGHPSAHGLSSGGDVREQARTAFREIEEVVAAAGGKMSDVVELLAAFVDIRDVDDVLDVAREFFAADYPAWTAMGTQGLQHRGSKVLIHAVAHLGTERKQCFTPDSLRWWRKYPISGACRKGPYVFISGQMPVDTDGNVVNAGDHRGQARYLFSRMKELTELAVNLKMTFSTSCLSASSAFIRAHVRDKEQRVLTMPFEQAPCSSIIGATSLHKHLRFHTVRAWRGGRRQADRLHAQELVLALLAGIRRYEERERPSTLHGGWSWHGYGWADRVPRRCCCASAICLQSHSRGGRDGERNHGKCC